MSAYSRDQSIYGHFLMPLALTNPMTPIPITPETPPRFPCKLRDSRGTWWKFAENDTFTGDLGDYTHWLPDQPEPPKVRPETVEEKHRREVAACDGTIGSPATPPEVPRSMTPEEARSVAEFFNAEMATPSSPQSASTLDDPRRQPVESAWDTAHIPPPAPVTAPTGETPRTDKIAHAGLDADTYMARMTDLARQLERELAEVRARYADDTGELMTLRTRLAEVERELAAAQRQIDMDTVRFKEMQDAGLRLEVALEGLKAQLAAARKDSERLDWLESRLRNMDSTRGGTWLRLGDKGRLQIHQHPIPHHPTELIWHDEHCILDSIPDGTCSVRAAIDAARKDTPS